MHTAVQIFRFTNVHRVRQTCRRWQTAGSHQRHPDVTLQQIIFRICLTYIWSSGTSIILLFDGAWFAFHGMIHDRKSFLKQQQRQQTAAVLTLWFVVVREHLRCSCGLGGLGSYCPNTIYSVSTFIIIIDWVEQIHWACGTLATNTQEWKGLVVNMSHLIFRQWRHPLLTKIRQWT